MIFSPSETRPLFVWVTRKSKMACLTIKHAVLCVNADYLEMVVYVTSSDSRHLCFASRNVYWGNVKFLLLGSLSHLVSLQFFVGSIFSIPKTAVCTCEHLLCQTSHVYGLQYDSYAALTSEEFHSTEKWIIYFFVCFHIFTGFVLKCFHVRVCVERNIWKREKIVSKLLIKSLF